MAAIKKDTASIWGSFATRGWIVKYIEQKPADSQRKIVLEAINRYLNCLNVVF